ncbi:MAG TPA: zinc-ribbon domain-containing protein [Polyangiaceae bacterium]|nr:zinc-ribbon domain-containing protein [Polyangiaceae bacterium]
MFCPNCGTQNDDSASACQKCAFNLKGAAAPKFKGTMLMVNAPPLGGMAPRPGGQGQPGAGASPSARPPAVAPRAAAPAGGKPMMKATMIGVAPPSPGGIAPPVPPGAGQTPSRPPPPPPASTRPVQPKFAGSAPTAPAFAMPPQVPAPVPAPAPVPFQSAPQPAPEPPRVPEVKAPDIVNPLGGTMVATPSPQSPASPGGFQPFSPAQAPAPVAGPDAGSFGATTPSGFAPGEFPSPNNPAVQPQPGAGWAQGAPVQPQPGAGWGQNAAGQPQPGAIAPYSPYGPPGAAPGQMQGPGAYGAPGITPHGPIGKMREPVMVLVLSFVTCGIFGAIALWSMLEELKRFRQKNDISPILFFLPVIQLLELIKLPAKVLEAKRMAGVPNAQEPNVILYLLLGIYMLPADLNEIWQVASAKQGGYGALPPSGS